MGTSPHNPSEGGGHGHGHEHPHDHGDAVGPPPPRAPGTDEERRRDWGRLWWTLGLTGVIAVAEAGGGYLANSLSLMSDAGHMLTDVSAIALSLVALYFAGRPADLKKTYGYYRAEILSALANGVLLLGITGFILYEAWGRFRAPERVEVLPAMLVGAIGLGANLLAIRFLRHAHSMNVRGALWHVIGDALSSVGVLVGMGLIWLTGWYPIDAIVAVVISIVIVIGSVKLVRDAVDVLLEAVPAHVDLDAVRALLAAVPGVSAVHDLHVWTISSGIYALSVHLVVQDPMVCNNDQILTSVKVDVYEKFGIDHTTIQIESETYAHVGPVH
ncbi:MAG: cation diffusion facilitator family transporter [Myxococcaceae bacterium]